MGKRGALAPTPFFLFWNCCKVFCAVLVTAKRSADELFMHYFHIRSSATAPHWETFVPRPLICPPLEKNPAGAHVLRLCPILPSCWYWYCTYKAKSCFGCKELTAVIPVKFEIYVSYLPLDVIRKTVFFCKFVCTFLLAVQHSFAVYSLRLIYVIFYVLIEGCHGSCITEICTVIKMTSMLSVSCWLWSMAIWS